MEINKIENTFLCGILLHHYRNQAANGGRGELLLLLRAGGTPKPTLRVNMKIHFLSTDIPSSSSSSSSSVPATVSGWLSIYNVMHSLYYHKLNSKLFLRPLIALWFTVHCKLQLMHLCLFLISFPYLPMYCVAYKGCCESHNNSHGHRKPSSLRIFKVCGSSLTLLRS